MLKALETGMGEGGKWFRLIDKVWSEKNLQSALEASPLQWWKRRSGWTKRGSSSKTKRRGNYYPAPTTKSREL
jgi:hypothetical protein